MLDKIQKVLDLKKADHYSKHLAAISMVIFLFVVNLFVFNYAMAASGSKLDTDVNYNLNKIAADYNKSISDYKAIASYDYNYNVLFEEGVKGWQQFGREVYYILYTKGY